MNRVILAVSLFLFSTKSFGFAWPLPKADLNMSIEMVEDFETNMSVNYNFEGIVALNNCSGSIVQYEGALDSDKAMILTNGHCLEGGFPDPGEVIVNKSSNRGFRVLDRSSKSLGVIYATKLIYGTMTKTDMALYLLDVTVGEIKQQFGFSPLTLSSSKAAVGTPIEVISGYWKRGYSCSIEAFIPELREGHWISKDSIRYSRPGCAVIGGTSGSPVIAEGTRTVVGVNNTINENGLRCTDNNPCEVDAGGNVVFYERGVGYAQQTYWIYSCLNEKKELDLKKAGCELFH